MAKDIRKLDSIDSLRDALEKGTLLIFKHSPYCGISRGARMEFEKFAKSCDEEIDIVFIDVVNNRDVSLAVEEMTSIKHESPQAILVKNGEPVWNASHFNVRKQSIEDALNGRDI